MRQHRLTFIVHSGVPMLAVCRRYRRLPDTSADDLHDLHREGAGRRTRFHTDLSGGSSSTWVKFFFNKKGVAAREIYNRANHPLEDETICDVCLYALEELSD